MEASQNSDLESRRELAGILDLCHGADLRVALSTFGHEQHQPVGFASAASIAAVASSLSRAMFTTMWGRTTPWLRGGSEEFCCFGRAEFYLSFSGRLAAGQQT